MDNSISAFNEMVVHLREWKMSVIRDYKQFNLDIALINHELNDPKIMTPSDFPVQLLDEAFTVRKEFVF
jgi:hypothetical protein